MSGDFRKLLSTRYILAIRWAVLLANELLIPAASYYESALCRKVLSAYPSELFGAQIALVASGTSLDEFIEDKLRQYAPNLQQGAAYRATRIRQAFPWHRRQRSATADIKSDWRSMLNSGDMSHLLDACRPDLLNERAFEALPDRLGEAAFIVPNVIPLLFEGKTAVPLTVENALHSIVNQSYFGSYAKDLRAAVFQNMSFLQSSAGVPSGDPDHDVDYRGLEMACRRHNVLGDIMASPTERLHHLADDPQFIAACVEASGISRREPLAGYVQGQRTASLSDISKVKILIVTALPLETAAVRATFDNDRTASSENDPHIYHLGAYHIDGNRPVRREVLLATQSDMGKVNAATVAANALRSFPSIQHVIMVGIAGGCPNPDKPNEHVRLGDIVVSNDAGIVEYDDVKTTEQGTEYRGSPQKPSYHLLQAVQQLAANALMGHRPWETYTDAALDKLDPSAGFSRPADAADTLHDHQGNVVPHPADPHQRPGCSAIHAGGIATADTLQKNPRARDELRDRFRVRAIEMEGSGIQGAAWASQRDVLVIRGICDYCDAFKNDVWQPFAAVAAAGYARALIEALPDQWFR